MSSQFPNKKVKTETWHSKRYLSILSNEHNELVFFKSIFSILDTYVAMLVCPESATAASGQVLFTNGGDQVVEDPSGSFPIIDQSIIYKKWDEKPKYKQTGEAEIIGHC